MTNADWLFTTYVGLMLFTLLRLWRFLPRMEMLEMAIFWTWICATGKWFFAKEPAPRFFSVAAATVVIVGGGVATRDVVLPKADISMSVMDATFTLSENPLLAVNHGNSVGVLDTIASFCVDDECYVLELTPRDSEERVLRPDEALELSLRGSVDVSDLMVVGQVPCQLIYEFLDTSDGEERVASAEFPCGQGLVD